MVKRTLKRILRAGRRRIPALDTSVELLAGLVSRVAAESRPRPPIDASDKGIEPGDTRGPVPTITPRDLTVVVMASGDTGSIARCLDSLRCHSPADARILAPKDEREQRVELRDLAGDVIILDSKVVVTSGWLDKLWLAAYSEPNVATVAPICSLASIDNPVSHRANSVARLGWLVEGLSDRRLPSNPVGDVPCLYVTRHALERVGPLEAELDAATQKVAFHGRALRAGMKHLIDDSTYVHQEVDRNAVTMSLRGPGYLQSRLDASRDSEHSSEHRDAILYVLHDADGGTGMTSLDLARKSSERRATFLLRMSESHWRWSRLQDGTEAELASFRFRDRWDATLPLGRERIEALLEILSSRRVHLVHVRHLLGAGPELLTLLAGLGYPLVYSVHDFLSVCPNTQLVNNRGRFCGGHCNWDQGDCSSWARFFPSLPLLKNSFVHHWRARIGRALVGCSALVTTSKSAKEIVETHFEHARDRPFHVIEHGRDFPSVGQPRRTAHPLRLVTMGGINEVKGGKLLVGILECARERGVPLELHVFGSIAPSLDSLRRVAEFHGPYEREEIVDLVRAIDPAAAIIASIWPETHCHTLTEAWAAGLPCFVSDLGALGERVRSQGGGWTFDPTDIDGCYELVTRTLGDVEAMERARGEVAQIEFTSASQMFAQYEEVYARLDDGPAQSRGSLDP